MNFSGLLVVLFDAVVFSLKMLGLAALASPFSPTIKNTDGKKVYLFAVGLVLLYLAIQAVLLVSF